MFCPSYSLLNVFQYVYHDTLMVVWNLEFLSVFIYLFIYRVTLLLNTNILLFSKSSNNKNHNLLIKKTYIQSTIIIKYDFSFHTFPCFFYYCESYQQKNTFQLKKIKLVSMKVFLEYIFYKL
jgi:hypothetical protein